MSNLSTLCQRLIGSVNIATSFREDTDALEDKRRVADVITKERHSRVGPEELARKWNVGLETAKSTLEATTQYGIRTAVHPMTRRVRVDHLSVMPRDVDVILLEKGHAFTFLCGTRTFFLEVNPYFSAGLLLARL